MKYKNSAALVMLLVLILVVIIEATLPPTISNDLIPHLDKAVHFLSFGLIAYLCAYVLLGYKIAQGWYNISTSIILIITLGIVEEFIQSHTPGRVASIYDLYADVAGASLFLALRKVQIAHREGLSP